MPTPLAYAPKSVLSTILHPLSPARSQNPTQIPLFSETPGPSGALSIPQHELRPDLHGRVLGRGSVCPAGPCLTLLCTCVPPVCSVMPYLQQSVLGEAPVVCLSPLLTQSSCTVARMAISLTSFEALLQHCLWTIAF